MTELFVYLVGRSKRKIVRHGGNNFTILLHTITERLNANILFRQSFQLFVQSTQNMRSSERQQCDSNTNTRKIV